MLAELTMLIAMCAPTVHASTMTALIKHESGFNPYAIGINKAERLKEQPKSKEQAVSIAEDLMQKGIDFDAGLGQINVRNFAWLGLNAQTVFDPCANLKASSVVLKDCYTRAMKQYRPGQQALSAAFSCYNTGNFRNGFSNGYVGKVYAAAGVSVPPIRTPYAERKPGHGPAQTSKRNGVRDGFSRDVPDGFSRGSVPDGFKQPRLLDESTSDQQPISTPSQGEAIQVSYVPQ